MEFLEASSESNHNQEEAREAARKHELDEDNQQVENELQKTVDALSTKPKDEKGGEKDRPDTEASEESHGTC
ncbi:MAG: hypothetical protein QGG71_11370 [Pirellulaceae bacterium]|jgi:hypothetical protein|nr:hypothetical protein [Pirellulaceae bacterium]